MALGVIGVAGVLVAAYFLVTAAAIARALGMTIFPDAAGAWIGASAILWSAAFALFVVAYAPILCRPRADGRPG